MTTEERYTACLVDARVPPHLHNGLLMYLVHHIKPGSFLYAVLSNDLREALGRADETSREDMYQLVMFLVWDAPAMAWGSPDKVAAWLSQRQDRAS